MNDYTAALQGLDNAESSFFAIASAYNNLANSHIDDSDSFIKDSNIRLQELREQSASWEAMFARLESRLTMLDPVTQKPRYGPKMRNNVSALLIRYAKLKEALESTNIAQHITTRAREILDKEERANAARMEMKAAEEREQNIKHQRLFEEKQQREKMQADKEMEEKRLEEECIATIAAKAEAKRTARKEQLQREHLIEQASKARLREQLNSITIGKEGLQRALDIFKQSIPDPKIFVDKIEKLRLIVSTICASPEKTEYRTLSKANEYLEQDFGQFEGGYLCFTALGFKEVGESPENTMLYLDEPSLEGDMDAWSDWFENLKECRAYLESCIENQRHIN